MLSNEILNMLEIAWKIKKSCLSEKKERFIKRRNELLQNFIEKLKNTLSSLNKMRFHSFSDAHFVTQRFNRF